MRIRSTGSQTPTAAARRVEDIAAFGNQANDAEPVLLPEQALAARDLQLRSGKPLEECALELGYVPEAGLNRRRSAGHDSPSRSTGADPLVIILSGADDPVVTAARELRSVIGNMGRIDSLPLRRVAMLSLQARTENSVLAANVAAAFSLSGQRTLLIDGNLRSPVQHGLFRVPQQPGVTELLEQKIDVIELIQPTSVSNLDLLTAGNTASANPDLVDRSALALATERACEAYEMVIIDAGEADQIGMLSAQGFDGCIVLVQKDVTTMKDARRLIGRLRDAGEQPLGLVVVD